MPPTLAGTGNRNVRKYVPKIPRSYIAKTLRRLLPSEKVIATLDRKQLTALAIQKRNLEELIKADPSRFFVPNKGGQYSFGTFWDKKPITHRVLIFPAGNKAGKTTIGSILIGERLLGRPLWGRETRDFDPLPTPAVGIAFTEDFESHRDTILPTMLSWWPKSEIKKVYYNNANCPSELEFQNGSVCKFKTYAQGADTAEGKDWDIVWDDEPPPSSVYSAQFRGVVSTGGLILVTATLLKEAWIFDEIDKDYATGFTAEIHDNEWLDPQAKKDFLDSLTPEERETRESGKPFNLTGVIYKGIRDADPYVIPPFEFHERWPYFIGVDPHERKPVHVGYFTLSPQNDVIMIGYGLFTGSIEEIFQKLNADIKAKGIPVFPRLCIMDPNRGAARQMDNMSWQQAFEEHGFDVMLGNDNVNIGHTKMYNYLWVNPELGRPRLRFTTDCRGRGGPIHQLLRYSWDEWVNNRTRSEKDVKEKPKQYNKDFPDICRYVAMADLNYDLLTTGPKVIEIASKEMKPYGRVGQPRRVLGRWG